MNPRHDGRASHELRPLVFERGVPGSAAGRVIVKAGRTTVLCTASVANEVPPWMVGKGKGWVTAEYSMLPGSTAPRKPRERAKIDGRTTEIQRLIGRSLRAVVDLQSLGERTITVDCDVLEADGGTRTASITGGFVALVEALVGLRAAGSFSSLPLTDSIAAVSAGIVDGQPLLDLDYREDVAAEVDMNVVMTGSGKFVEVQGTGEEATFTHGQLLALVDLAAQGVHQLREAQHKALADLWPFSE
ncbi:MAG: ribonuclease PH [Pirellulales bacterium]